MVLTSPHGQPLPFAYRWAVANGLRRFTPWFILDSPEEIAGVGHEFQKETGIESCVFARRYDMDDVAAFVIRDGIIQDAVVSAHLSWVGYRDAFVEIEHFDDFWDWLAGRALPDMAEWTSDEADIQEALNDGAV